MRCLVVADLHYALPQFDWLVHVADRYDLMIIAGDHIDLSALADPGSQTVVIRKYIELLRTKTRIAICSGNHDLDSRNDAGEKVAKWLDTFASADVRTDWQSFDADDARVTVCAWWDGPLTRDRIGEQLAADASQRRGPWYWIYHAPSEASATSWTGSRHSGDAALLGWINQYRPDMVFSGHIHQAPFTKAGSWVDRIGPTWVFNIGQHAGAPPAHMVFDTAEKEAVWMSAAGIQSIRLDQPLDQPLQRPLPRLVAPPDWFRSRDPVAGQSPA